MADIKDDTEKSKRDRSPSFPFIPLNKAIERAREFHDKYKHHPARAINAVSEAWSYKTKSSGASQTIAALKAYGLLSDSGTGTDRKISLTELAKSILVDERPGVREKALRIAALRPEIISSHWERWDNDRPPDAECISELHLDKGFTKDSAQKFLSIYDETIAYANLSKEANMKDSDSNHMDEPDAKNPKKSAQTVKPGMQQATFPLDEGEVFFQWPSTLSNASLEDLNAWLELLKRKIERSTKQSDQGSDES
jgi:hypothetical protein